MTRTTARIMAKTFLVVALQVVLCYLAPNAIISLLIGLMSSRVHTANVKDEVSRDYGR